MRRNLLWRCASIVFVLLVFGSVGIYPLLASSWGLPAPSWLMAKQLKLGLDLNGGVHLVLRVVMDKGISPEEKRELVAHARQTIERRVNELGVAEPTIAEHGADGDQILVELPGVYDVERAKAVLQTVGVLELRIVERGPSASADDLLVSGADIRTARPTLDEYNQPAVTFTLTTDAGRRFAALTAQNIGRSLAIVLDGKVHSAPVIEGRIAGDGNIRGGFTAQEAQDLALLLRSGALRTPLAYVAQHTIGASLGADSIRAGITASLAGLVLIVSFLVAYYRLSGVNAVAAMLANLVLLLGLMAYLGAVMTLPGIAGFVLTMGIGVDSNVLIFERIKEELASGQAEGQASAQAVRAAVAAGFNRVFLTLLDTHTAALISAAFLFQFGTGAIRGFAVTLSVGLLVNLVTSTFVSRTLFQLVLARQQGGTLSI